MESSAILHVLGKFTRNSNYPENFTSAQPHLEKPFTECTKRLFDHGSDFPTGIEPVSPADGLTELITEGLDGEQIWEELELTNRPLLKHTMRHVAKLLTSRAGVTFLRTRIKEGKPSETKENVESEKDEPEVGYDGSQDLFADSEDVAASFSDLSDQDSDTNFDIEDSEAQSKKAARKPSGKAAPRFQGRPSMVDDQFFKLSEMERFLEMEDAKEERRRQREESGRGPEEEEEEDPEEEMDSESVDLFNDLWSDEESDVEESQGTSARNMHYSDYFETNDCKKTSKKKKRVSFKELDAEDENGETDDDDDDDNTDSRRIKSHNDEGEDFEKDGDNSDEIEGEDLEDILGGIANGKKSSFERRQEKLKNKIASLEEANITQKPWQLSGEAKATKRPENSLLEENLDFEVASKPAPEITEETTQALEDIIRQRVLDHAWDDVERKQRRVEEPYEFKKRITLDQEKSKQSLAEIYEREYLKQSEQDKEEKENPVHAEIKTTMDALFVKLDALSNFHYMPKPVLPEVKIVKNVPSISMEEVAPVTATDASLMAPEEIQEKSKSELKGDTEKTPSDRKQALRQKKKRQRVRAREKVKKQRAAENVKPGTGNHQYSMKGALQRLEQDSKLPSSKTTIIKDDKREKTPKSSKSFFGRLQDEVTSELRGVKTKRKPPKQATSSKKLKL